MTIETCDFKGKKVIVRVDFNVPLDDNGNITDDTRIRGALPTLKKVLADGGSLIIMSHMGKPKGKVNPKFSLGQIVDAVSEKLGVKVDDVFSTLQAFLGGLQVNDFTRFGRTWKVVMQAEPQYRSDANDIRYFFVRSNTNAMVPLATLVKPVPISGLLPAAGLASGS